MIKELNSAKRIIRSFISQLSNYEAELGNGVAY